MNLITPDYYSDSTWTSMPLKLPATWLFVEQHDQIANKETINPGITGSLCGESTSDWWILLKKGNQ